MVPEAPAPVVPVAEDPTGLAVAPDVPAVADPPGAPGDPPAALEPEAGLTVALLDTGGGRVEEEAWGEGAAWVDEGAEVATA